MRLLLLIIVTTIFSVGAMASTKCQVNAYLSSFEGKEKLSSLVERSKGLIISKLEEIGIEEDQISVKVVFPKTKDQLAATYQVEIKSKNLKADSSRIDLSKVIRDEDCGLEVRIFGGELLNVENGKNFGSLGVVKEFIKLN